MLCVVRVKSVVLCMEVVGLMKGKGTGILCGCGNGVIIVRVCGRAELNRDFFQIKFGQRKVSG